MNPVLDAAVLGPLRQSIGRTVLAAIAIALGVALGFAIFLINRAAAVEVTLASRNLFGLADLTIEGAVDGFSESLYPIVARLPGVAVASPVLEVRVRLADERMPLTLLGFDFFRSRQLQPAIITSITDTNDAGSAGQRFEFLDRKQLFLSAAAAERLRLGSGDTLTAQIGLRQVTFTVAGVLPAQSLAQAAGVLDIAAAQWQLDRLGVLTRIDLRLTPGMDPERMRQTLAAHLPANVRVTTPGRATDEALRLSRAYRANLTALALVALITGTFLVYATQSLAVLRRRRELALLHALGVTRTEQLRHVLLGSAVVGSIGAALGVALGIGIAALGLRLFGMYLGVGYFQGLTPTLRVGPLECAGFLLLGIVSAVIGSVWPARAAARIPTAVALKSGDYAASEVTDKTGIAVVLVILGVALLFAPPIAELPLGGYAAIACLLFAAVLFLPAMAPHLLLRLPRWAQSVPYELGVGHLRATAQQASASIAAVLVSVSLMVAMAIMVNSFRLSLDQWLARALPADLYLRLGGLGQAADLAPELLERLQRLPGVARIETHRSTEVYLTSARAPVVLIARPMSEALAPRRLILERRTDTPLPAGAVPLWISEATADLYELDVGSSLSLPLGSTVVTGSVRGIWRDYERQNGAIIIDQAMYRQLVDDREVNAVLFWLDPGVELDSVAGAVRSVLPAGGNYELRFPAEVRRLSLTAFDRTFAITYVLEAVAVLIGLFGISAHASAQVLARRGELGMLRHLGFRRREIAAMLGLEGAWLGALGVLFGALLGGVVGLILIYVVNRQSFRWSMDLYVPYVPLLILGVVLIVAAAAISMWSGRQAMSSAMIRAVKEDW